MSRQSSKCVQIIVNVDTEVREVRAPSRDGRSKIHLKIDLEVQPQDDVYDPEFMLSDPEDGEFISVKPHGRDQEIDLSKFPIKPIVFFHFHLKNSKGLRFPEDQAQVIGINKADVGSLDAGCPRQPGIATGQFRVTHVSGNGKYMTLRDENSDGGTYRFALFVCRDTTLAAICDPRIINK